MSLSARERYLMLLGRQILERELNLPQHLPYDIRRDVRRRQIRMVGRGIGIRNKQIEEYIENEEEYDES